MNIIHKDLIIGVVMSYYKVGRTRGLFGEIKIQGSKNAALPLIAAALLHKGQTIIRNCPNIFKEGMNPLKKIYQIWAQM